MRRLPLCLLILLIGFAVEARAEYRAAAVSGSAFFVDTTMDGSSAIKDWQSYKGYRIRITDTSSYTAEGYAVSGTGETLGSQLLTGWTNFAGAPYETFTSSGVSVSPAINTTGYGNFYSNAVPLSSNVLFRFQFSLTKTSGALPYTLSANSASHGNYSGGMSYAQVVEGENSRYFTATGSGDELSFLTGNGIAANYNITTPILKSVLTPPASGCSVFSLPDLTTNSFAKTEASFNPNAIAKWSVVSMRRTVRSVVNH